MFHCIYSVTAKTCLKVTTYVNAKRKYSHHIRPNDLSGMQRAKIHNLFMLSSVMIAIK